MKQKKSESDSYQAWVDELKVGDKVALEYHRFDGTVTYEFKTVAHITPTRLIRLEGHTEDFNSFGHVREKRGGASWHRSAAKLLPITDVMKTANESAALAYKIRKAVESDKLKSAPLKTLRAVWALLKDVVDK